MDNKSKVIFMQAFIINGIFYLYEIILAMNCHKQMSNLNYKYIYLQMEHVIGY